MDQTQFTLDSLLNLINFMNHLDTEEKTELRHNCESSGTNLAAMILLESKT